MPTGYTAKLSDGKQSFKDFAMGCMGAFANNDWMNTLIESLNDV